MKNPTSINNTKNNAKMNTTTVLVLIIAVLPILLFALTKMFPPMGTDTKASTSSTLDETKKTRISAAERRAQRAEERKAKKAETATTVQHGMAPDPGMATFPPAPMEFGGFDGGFGLGMGGFDNGMAMAPGGFGGGFGGPGMGGGFGGGFGGPGFGGPF